MEVPASTQSERRDRPDPLHDNLQGVREMGWRWLTRQAFIASVRHLAEQHHLDLNILQGDDTNTVAKKAAMASVIPAVVPETRNQPRL
jgi:hypothetical protein